MGAPSAAGRLDPRRILTGHCARYVSAAFGREGAELPGASVQTPLVSIVTPSFNYGRYIEDCLESVARQTYARIEHVVLDALSTDDTADVLARYRSRPNLTIVSEKDGGQADALEKGFARVRGDVLCWLNADDFYLHERVVEEAVRYLEANPGFDIVTGRGWYVDERGERTREIAEPLERIARELRYYDTFLQPATFWRRRAHRPIRTELQFTFDWRLFLDMQRAGSRILAVDDSWAAYRVHGVNKTALDPVERRREIAALLRSEFGPASPQHLWARAVEAGYAVADRTGLRVVRRAFWAANHVMWKLTGRRVFAG